MKNIYPLALLLLGLTLISSCKNTNSKQVELAESAEPCCTQVEKTCCDKTETTSEEIVKVIYFHNERRCATCMAVEEVSKEVIAVLDSSKISFSSYQIGSEECAELEKELKITGQTLLVIGANGTSDLTNFAFMNARVNPDKFKEELSNVINL
ncbi:MAG: nitrophenyl compound nitroreductase subunit ArsF family protein [Prolixibacteraceae bacterium]|jgi:hypothetical protein|nr:nitrophenyl compound nitroreductase subunit ArsF family protein [Prolixibacteraceae bacterium]